jgi:hypothetical protein
MGRLDLHAQFLEIVENVYFQPPDNLKISFPCIIYKRDYQFVTFANGYPYHHKVRYLVTYVDKDPDSPNLKKISDMQMCTFDRHFTADKLNHDVFRIFF